MDLKLDKNKLQGKIREQMNREVKARRQFNQKWSFMRNGETNKFYDISYLDKKVTENEVEENAESNQIRGDAYFLSPIMLDSMKMCRCGRQQKGSHIIKCLQKGLIKYSEGRIGHNEDPHREPNIPKTSNGLNGFYKPKYWHLEFSTYHTSPKTYLKHKITDQIYDNIVIG